MMTILLVVGACLILLSSWAVFSSIQNRRKALQTRFSATALGTDVAATLRAAEARFADIRSDQAKEIVWRNPESRSRTEIALVYIHGFSASSGEIRPVPDLVAEALDANLYFTRLTGHGRTPDAMAEASVAGWVDDLAEALAIGERIGQTLVVMATSTGASLVTAMLHHPTFAGRISAAIFVSPNYGLRSRAGSLLMSPYLRRLAVALMGPTRSFQPINDRHTDLWTATYPSKALLPMAEMVALACAAPVEQEKCPALFIISPHDLVVDPQATRDLASRWGGPHRLIEIAKVDDPYCHVLAGDALSPSSTRTVSGLMVDWLDEMGFRRPGRKASATNSLVDRSRI